MVVSDKFRLQASRPAALGNSVMKHGALVTLGMGGFGCLVARKSQERTKGFFDYCVHLEADQRTAAFRN